MRTRKFIELSRAIKEIEDLPNCYNGFSDTYDKATIIGVLEEVPPADVVEVVRCKECSRQLICFHSDSYFCADGRRIDE